MNLMERAAVIHYHRHRIADFGVGQAQALGWTHAASQRRRFERMARSVDFTDASVLDLGCGTGDLKVFLDARFKGVRYLGIEHVPEFIDEARRRFGHDELAAFALGDFHVMPLPRADHVVACGSLSYRSTDPSFVFKAIAKMFSCAARSVILDLLDEAHMSEHPLLMAHDIGDVRAFCRMLSPCVQCVRGERVGDVMLVLKAGG